MKMDLAETKSIYLKIRCSVKNKKRGEVFIVRRKFNKRSQITYTRLHR